MGEWRVFLDRSGPHPFDLWATLNVPLSQTSAPAQRTDLYLVATPDVGVKFRNEGSGAHLLEVKVRLKRKKRGVEKWAKILCDRVSDDPRAFGAAEFRRELQHHRLLTGKYAAALEAVLAAWSEAPPVRLALVKERRQWHVPGSAVLVEQTDFAVLRDGAPVGPPFRTLNLEAAKAKDVYRVLRKAGLVAAVATRVYMLGCAGHRLCAEARDDATGCITAGFPEFLVHLRPLYAAALPPPASNGVLHHPAPGSSSTVPTPPVEPLRSA